MSDPDQYLSLLMSTLTASVYPESAWLLLKASDAPRKRIRGAICNALARRGYGLVKFRPFEVKARESGVDWPMFGYSMVGKKRLANIQFCLETVQKENIPGDFVECGVWRGGASMFAKAVLTCLDDESRTVWLCDSFEGMPAQRAEDKVDPDLVGRVAVSLEQVQENFRRFGFLNGRVKFVKGWFSDSLPNAPIEKISILRLDGDYYSSTTDALTSLYDRVAPGGFIIVDDYYAFKSCEQAITDFCEQRQIRPDLVKIDDIGVYFRKGAI
jgi:O-methyltransferase